MKNKEDIDAKVSQFIRDNDFQFNPHMKVILTDFAIWLDSLKDKND